MKISLPPSGLKKLIHLRDLRIHVNPYECHQEDIVACIWSLWNLETLHLRGWYLKAISSEMWKLKRPRHLYADGGITITAVMSGSDSKTMSDHQTLYSVYMDPQTASLMNNDRFPKLGKLGLVAHSSMGEEFQRLGHLSNLHTLKIYKALDLPSNAGAFLSNLTKITLIDWLRFESRFMNTLGRLTNLQVLKLTVLSHYYLQDEFDINCAAGEFPKLEVFKMESIKVKSWRLDKGAMPHLQCLVINVCRSLTDLPEELWSLTTLQEVQVWWPDTELAISLQNVEVKSGCKLIIDPPPTKAKPNSA